MIWRTGWGEHDAREKIMAFMLEYATYLSNRFKIGEDGKVPYQRVKGKKPTVLGVEFGEKQFFKVKIGNKLQKIKSRWKLGIFVGIRWKSNEVIVSTPEGITTVKTVRRIPESKRWGRRYGEVGGMDALA